MLYSSGKFNTFLSPRSVFEHSVFSFQFLTHYFPAEKKLNRSKGNSDDDERVRGKRDVTDKKKKKRRYKSSDSHSSYSSDSESYSSESNSDSDSDSDSSSETSSSSDRRHKRRKKTSKKDKKRKRGRRRDKRPSRHNRRSKRKSKWCVVDSSGLHKRKVLYFGLYLIVCLCDVLLSHNAQELGEF